MFYPHNSWYLDRIYLFSPLLVERNAFANVQLEVIWQELCAESIPHIDYPVSIVGGFMGMCYLDNGLAFFLIYFF